MNLEKKNIKSGIEKFADYLVKNGHDFYGFILKISIVSMFIFSWAYSIFWIQDIESMGDMGKMFMGIVTTSFVGLVNKYIKSDGVSSKGNTENRQV